MRGKVPFSSWVRRGYGITPAYAGKRETEHNVVEMSRDHPCVCGEKESVEEKKTRAEGSPLRMRGKDSV